MYWIFPSKTSTLELKNILHSICFSLRDLIHFTKDFFSKNHIFVLSSDAFILLSEFLLIFSLLEIFIALALGQSISCGNQGIKENAAVSALEGKGWQNQHNQETVKLNFCNEGPGRSIDVPRLPTSLMLILSTSNNWTEWSNIGWFGFRCLSVCLGIFFFFVVSWLTFNTSRESRQFWPLATFTLVLTQPLKSRNSWIWIVN